MPLCTETIRAREYQITACHPPMNAELSKILQESGWGNGFKIPFANAENKALEKQLDAMHKRYVELASLREDDKEHLENVKKHYNRVHHDLGLYQHLMNAKKLEVSTAEKGASFAERLLSHCKDDRDRTEKILKEIKERNNEKISRLDQRKATVVELMNLSEFNGRALQKWKAKTDFMEDDIKSIEQFKGEDAELNTHLDKRVVDVSAANKQLYRALDLQAMETGKLQIQFQRMTQRFHKLHRYRNKLIRMWTSSVEAMKSRDSELTEIAEVYRETRDRQRSVDVKIREREGLLTEARRSVRYTRIITHQAERKINTIRQNILKLLEVENTLRGDYMTLQGIVANVSVEVKAVRAKTEKIEADLGSWEKRAAEAEAECIVLRSRLESAFDWKGDSNKALAQAEQMLREQHEICIDLDQEIKTLRQSLFEINAIKTETEQEMDSKTEKIRKAKKISGYYTAKEHRGNETVGKLRAGIFTADLRKTQLESRIDAIQNDALTSEAYLENQSLVQKLKKGVDKVRRDARFLTHEVEHDIRMVYELSHKIVHWQETNATEGLDLKNLNLDCISLEKSIKKQQKDNINQQFRLSMYKVTVRRTEALLEAEKESMSTLTQQRMSVQGAVKERAEEIAMHTHLNKSLKKKVLEQVNQLRLSLAEMRRQIDKQKSSFQKLHEAFQLGQAETMSFTESVKAMAREREALGHQRLQWEAKVEETKKEIEGLRTNVNLMNTSNCQLKTSMSPATPDSLEHKKMMEMEAAEKTALVRKHHAKRLLRKFKDDSDILQTSIHSIKHQIHSVGYTCHAKMRLASLLGGEVITQQDKIHRWTNLSIRLLVDIKRYLPPERLRLVEADLKMRFLEEKFEFAVVMIEKLMGFFPETKERITHFLSQEKFLLSDVHSRIAQDLKIGFKANPNRRVMYPEVQNVSSASYANLVDNVQLTEAERKESAMMNAATGTLQGRRKKKKGGFKAFKANFSILKVDQQLRH